MMRFLYSKPAPCLLDSPDESSSLKVRTVIEDNQFVHLSDTVIAEPAQGSTRDFQHILIHEGDKRGAQCRKYYFIYVPQKAMPGDTFYVVVEEAKIQVTCPQIHKAGQKVVVTMERPAKFDHE